MSEEPQKEPGFEYNPEVKKSGCFDPLTSLVTGLGCCGCLPIIILFVFAFGMGMGLTNINIADEIFGGIYNNNGNPGSSYIPFDKNCCVKKVLEMKPYKPPVDEKMAENYCNWIIEWSKKHNVDPALTASIIQQESAFNAHIGSPAGAVGLMQLMPGTATEVGVTDRTDPNQSIMGGTRYFRRMMNYFQNNTKCALGAYNGGPGNVRKDSNGNCTFVTAEQNKYVPAVLSHYQEWRKCLIGNVTNGNYCFPADNLESKWDGNYYGPAPGDIGFDINVKSGAKVYAVADGIIDPNRYGIGDGWGGYRLWIITGGTRDYYYAHLDKVFVKPGQKVKKCDLIGEIDDATGGTIHLHFGIGVGTNQPRESGPGLQYASGNWWINPSSFLYSIKK
jgi:hypothetical protein